MGQRFYKTLLFASLAVLFHAAYSTTEWRQYARKTDKLFGSVPLDIAIQTFLGLFLAMVSVLKIAGEFKEIRAAVELSQKSWENARNRPSFYGFNHRGKALHPDYIPPPAPSSSSTAAAKRSVTEIPERFLS